MRPWTGLPELSVLNRRACVRLLLAGTGGALCSSTMRALAQGATPVPQASDLARLFPGERALPADLELESAGTREEIAQVAGTFRNSRDASQVLAGWGWVGNAWRSYAARPGAGGASPARVEISVHEFTSSTGAAYALSYFAHDRAVALQHHEELGGSLLPCDAMVTGDGSATRFIRRGNLVVRVTVVMPRPVDAAADTSPLVIATDLALEVLANAEEPAPARQVAC